MKRHFFKQSLLRTMMIVATLLFMMPAQNAWADNVATATVDGNTYTYSSLEAAVSAANFSVLYLSVKWSADDHQEWVDSWNRI